MRNKGDIIKEAKKLIKEYELVTNGNKSVRTCLKRAYDLYWNLKELIYIIESENKS